MNPFAARRPILPARIHGEGDAGLRNGEEMWFDLMEIATFA